VLETTGRARERQHHEVGPGVRPKSIFDSIPWLRPQTRDAPISTSLKNVAKKHGKTVTFNAQALFGDTVQACTPTNHCWKKGQTALCRQRVRRFEPNGPLLYRGVLNTPKALAASAILRPNSYKRLVPGYERR